jgi:putative MATE family efflux protein
MEKRINLTEGSITDKLVKLSLPIMGTSFIQTAYNLINMLWIGRMGSNAVAAVGTGGFYTWLAMAFVMVSKTGAEIKVSQSIGRKDFEETKAYVIGAIQINLILSIIYTIVLILFNKQLIDFFKLGDEEVISMGRIYLTTIAWCMIFYFINPVFTAIFNGAGDSKTPFIINTIGIVLNSILDPLFIFGVGPFAKMGVKGAAVATIFSQIIVSLCFLIVILKSKEKFLKVNIFKKLETEHIKYLCHIGIPGAIQSGLFTIFSMFLGRIISVFGPVAIAVQKVGSQIESISWLTAGGFSTALGTFVGQNYGAKKYDRINKGYKVTMLFAIGVGIFASILLIFAGDLVFSFFIQEDEAIKEGGQYLKILGYSQLFMCIEITTTGAFNGLGRTYMPSIISILLTGARIPAAYALSQISTLGVDGVWWSISVSSILKGIVIGGAYLILLRIDKLYSKR